MDSDGGAIPGAVIKLMLLEGTAPVLTTVATADGFFTLSGVRPDSYDLTIEADGYQLYSIRGVRIYPAQETVLPAVALTIQPLTIRVEVEAAPETIQTANAEIATTIDVEQVRTLPVLDRYPLSLIQTQAGVTRSGSVTVINGQRTSSANVTLDGINIQDNYVRDNSLTYVPNLIALDQIAEFTLSVSNANASMGGGSSHVSFVTPSGTNNTEIHGSVFFYNRNNALAANEWFDNADNVEKPSLNQNRIGASIAGPVRRDKFYFYGNYEAFRYGVESTPDTTILTQDARAGIFTYEDQTGQIRKVNVLQAAGVPADSVMQQILTTIPGPENINHFRVGDSRESLLRNTAGFSFVRKGHHNRDNATGKLDYYLSPVNLFAGTFLWNRQDVTRSDLSNDFSEIPKVYNDDRRKLLSVAWRWNPRSRLTNELRGGFNLAPLTFSTGENFGDSIITGMVYSNPVNVFRAQGRKTNTFTLLDNAAYSRGRHSFMFGFQMQDIRVEEWNEAGTTPSYFVGTNFATPSLGAQQLPGISASDLTAANRLLATLAGFISGYSQTFNITSRSSGFVAGAPRLRHYNLNNYAFYFQDDWRIARRLSLNLGLRYEVPSVVDERDSLALLPVVQNNDPVQTLLSNATLDFAGADAGRPFYGKDRNNFAPNVGLAWDVFGDSRTAFRAAYGLSYVNDETIRAVLNMVDFNEGLSSVASSASLNARASAPPPVPIPAFRVPRTFEDNYRINPFTAFGLPDPNLRTPYVQQWSVGVQREFKRAIVEVRYVGNHSTKLFRSFDVNPELTIENGFLDDFKRAQQNGRLALARNGVFDPSFNASIPGSQPLLVFPSLVAGGLLANSLVRSTIQTGQAGELAFLYHFNGLSGPVAFYRNPVSLASLIIANHSNATYNALQIDVRRRLQEGLQFQANYTYGKVLSDSDGVASHRFEEFRDPNNGKIDRARPSFDITHAIKGNVGYDLPIRGRAALFGVLSGWKVSGIARLQSGNPFSVLSGRGTLLRAFRSGQNTAASSLSKQELDRIFQLRMTDDGPFIVPQSVIGSDGRGVSPDSAEPFSGQAFFNPEPGQIGGLQRRWFSGPWVFNMDMALLKQINLREGHTLEFRAEALNVFNHPEWFVDNQNVNAVDFGRIKTTSNEPRRIQLSLHYRF